MTGAEQSTGSGGRNGEPEEPEDREDPGAPGAEPGAAAGGRRPAGDDDRTDDAEVDEEARESFPSSDAPSHWAG